MNFGYQIFNILLEKEIPIVSKVSGVIVMQIMNIFGVRRVRSSRFRTQDSGAPNFGFRVFWGFSGFWDSGFRVQDFRVRGSGLEKYFPPHVEEVELLINRASKADRSKPLQIVKPLPTQNLPSLFGESPSSEECAVAILPVGGRMLLASQPSSRQQQTECVSWESLFPTMYLYIPLYILSMSCNCHIV